MSFKKVNLSGRYYPDACCTSPYLAEFVEDLRSSGYTAISISFYKRGILHLGRWADASEIPVNRFNDDVLIKFRKHLKRCRCSANNLGQLKPARLAAVLFLAYIRRAKLAAPAPVLPVKRSPIMTDFRAWMTAHRGLSSRTIDTYEQALGCFFQKLGEDPALWRVSAIRSFVLKRSQLRGRAEVKRLTNSLRALLRFLAIQGRCEIGWDGIVPTIPQWKLSALPRYLEPEVVEQVIAACDRPTPHGLRDRAIILLLARLGLRAGDIVNMKLGDIDWKQGTLRVCGKQRREARLPLPQEIGNAILAYLKRGRPRVDLDSVFLCLQAPYRPFGTSSCVAYIVKKALGRAGVKDAPWQGAHLLRHSAATAMIREGSTLEAVATMLRHKSIDTAAHYAKVDIGMLLTVVQAWPAGALC